MHALGLGDGTTASNSPTARLFASLSNTLDARSPSFSSRFLFPSGDTERVDTCSPCKRPALIATLDAVNSVCSTMPVDRVRPGLSILGGGLKFWKGFGRDNGASSQVSPRLPSLASSAGVAFSFLHNLMASIFSCRPTRR